MAGTDAAGEKHYLYANYYKNKNEKVGFGLT
jgi:hypothetical protein